MMAYRRYRKDETMFAEVEEVRVVGDRGH